ncbi:MAG: DUF4292 domain-containing protein [Mucilaginibacter sp.]
MRKNILNKLAILSCMLMMVSCAAHKQLVANQPAQAAPPAVKPDSKLAEIKQHQLVFNTFAAKASTKLNIDGGTNDVTLNMRIDHGKKIWVSITAVLGIEVARALITPDSILIINKLQGVYIKKPFSYVYQYANRQVNYNMLESIFVGNAMPEALNDRRVHILDNNGTVSLTGDLEDLAYKLLFGQEVKVNQLNLGSPDDGQSLQVNNSAFITQANQLVPSQIDIQSVSHNKKIKANLHFIKVDLDQPLQYPFNIPESYQPADQN